MSYRQKGINWTGLFMTQLLLSTVYTRLPYFPINPTRYIYVYSMPIYIAYIFITKLYKYKVDIVDTCINI